MREVFLGKTTYLFFFVFSMLIIADFTYKYLLDNNINPSTFYFKKEFSDNKQFVALASYPLEYLNRKPFESELMKQLYSYQIFRFNIANFTEITEKEDSLSDLIVLKNGRIIEITFNSKEERKAFNDHVLRINKENKKETKIIGE